MWRCRVPAPTRAQQPRPSSSTDVLRAGLAGRDERHHGSQLGTDLLDLVGPALFAQRVEALATTAVLGHPLLGEGAIADLAEDRLHLGFGLFADDARPAREVAVLGRVGDGEPHAGEAASVHEVDD